MILKLGVAKYTSSLWFKVLIDTTTLPERILQHLSTPDVYIGNNACTHNHLHHQHFYWWQKASEPDSSQDWTKCQIFLWFNLSNLNMTVIFLTDFLKWESWLCWGSPRLNMLLTCVWMSLYRERLSFIRHRLDPWAKNMGQMRQVPAENWIQLEPIFLFIAYFPGVYSGHIIFSIDKKNQIEIITRASLMSWI